MGKINVLSFAVANLIAAGEVVDRPASVIKELLENAIDSGADRITVEIQNGGVTFMRVTDNGCGMEAEDLPIAIRRHATSKIKEAEDLDGILTLGFRGEALAAIASVSHLRIISKTKDAVSGAMLDSRGGEILGIYERAASDGTSVIVEDLFANVPARRKFLKKDVTEAAAVSAAVEKIALSKPHIAFRLIVDGNVRLETVGDGNLKNTIYSVFGRDFASKLIEVKGEGEGISINGFIGRSDNVRANRNYQNFFINGRYVKSKTACAAIEQAFTSYIPPEKFPCCVLYITVNPMSVDVNVHPAKLEVKFSNEKPVFEAIYYAVRNALEENVTRPDFSVSKTNHFTGRVSDSQVAIADKREESLKKRQISAELFHSENVSGTKQSTDKFVRMTAEEYAKEYLGGKGSVKKKQENPAEKSEEKKESRSEAHPKSENKAEMKIQPEERPSFEQISNEIAPKPEPEIPTATAAAVEPQMTADIEKTDLPKIEEEAPAPKKLGYRIVGEVFNSYVVVELGEKMLLVDKHAAHERVIFEQLKAGMKQGAPTSQLLLLPLEIMMTSTEVSALNEFRKEIEAVGFEFETGKYTVNVTAVPEGVSLEAVSDMLAVMADRMKNNTGTAMLTRDIIFEKALYQASCKAAIKAGREYPPEYVAWLVDKLMELPDITFCPHGRPVAMELSKKKIDHQFERC
ncbi:MAG: DNA mismatch repair endonuclease MutL [Ruminococcaceae bacterium]|nr:DNA mismatch repair endonuclease MutL [Oscillospiraceae bacterium]